MDFSSDFWWFLNLLYQCFVSNFIFEKLCFIKDYLRKHICIIGWCTKYIHIESTTAYVPSSELRLSHPPLSPASALCPSPWNKRGGGGYTCVGVRGWGSSNSNTREKASTLPTL
jgi:hypothetical protein